MGDLIMSVPAIRALKETLSSEITVLTSSMAAAIVPYIPEIDDSIIFDLPWVKAKEAIGGEEILNLVQILKQRKFDAAVIFSVFSQNPLPAAMIAYMAGIPLRLAYCRENPYGLLTDWVADKEPYSFIQHQVDRDLSLVEAIDCFTTKKSLSLTIPDSADETLKSILAEVGLNSDKSWLIFHAGVSEEKRAYPAELWIETAKKLVEEKDFQILFSGSEAEKEMCEELAKKTGKGAFSVAGKLTLAQFITLVKQAPVVVSVNTGTVHIAAAVATPVVVLYAQTNPQHTPWMVSNRVLEFEVEEKNRSKNEVLQFMYKGLYKKPAPMPAPCEIMNAVDELIEAHK